MGRLENFERYMDKLVDGKEDTVNVLYALRIGASRTEKEALDEAIDAVEKEPCADAVSRQAVDEMIKAEMPERGMWEIEGDKGKETVCEVCVDLIQKLSALPPVKPQEPRTGHWIRWEYSTRRCSECDCIVTHEYKFCPDCGAKMESEV